MINRNKQSKRNIFCQFAVILTPHDLFACTINYEIDCLSVFVILSQVTKRKFK